MFVLSLRLVAVASLCAASLAHATIVIPGAGADPGPVDTFGAIPAATFGGSGIPNTAMAISTLVDGPNTITLGIAATPRFSGTPVGNDGMGSYTVNAGEGDPGLSLWNFSFYTNVDGPGSYLYRISYDLDSAAGNDLGTHGTIEFSNLTTGTQTVESSQNLGFGFLTTGAPGVTPPSPLPTFDPTELGEYTFQISVLTNSFFPTELDRVSMAVSAVPEPTAALFGTLLAGGLGLTVNRRRSKD